ncbi:MAG TPA: helix-turn-helix transcriptional regulator [Croceibacterium sp.]|nr:helix-turn-helix transcriptional regulator [Croceibacterium sp.]
MSLSPFGEMLREWRGRRKLSQLDLALASEVSSRHLSFVETGRATPSAPLVDRFARELTMPLRAHNALRIAAGYAPVHSERPLDDPALAEARAIVQRVLNAHEPSPALAIDRAWNLVDANAALPMLLAGIDEELLQPPLNVLRVALHPRGLAPRIVNFSEWRAHLLARLEAQIAASGDAALIALDQELRRLPFPDTAPPPRLSGPAIAVPLLLESPVGRLSFISTTTVFGTPLDVTLSELAIEAFFPADQETGERLRVLTAG